LARQFKVKLRDYYSIDVSVDVHVRRVLTRLGIVEEGASLERVVYAAQAISPEFLGLIDAPAFERGREVCRPRKPKCEECYLRRWCPSAGASGTLTTRGRS
jgi:endonuclease III